MEEPGTCCPLYLLCRTPPQKDAASIRAKRTFSLRPKFSLLIFNYSLFIIIHFKRIIPKQGSQFSAGIDVFGKLIRESNDGDILVEQRDVS